MSKPKYTYVSYDYTFLYNQNDGWGFLPTAIKVAAKTIGFDIVEATPPEPPVGQFFYMDYIPIDDSESTTATTATYKSRQSGSTNLNAWYDIYQFEKIKKERQQNYFKRMNFFKNLRQRRNGKKV
jgi:hypothetical protein